MLKYIPRGYNNFDVDFHVWLNDKPTVEDLISYALYPKVFKEYLQYKQEYGNLSTLGSDIFFHGLYEGETCEVDVDKHILQIKLVDIGNLDEESCRRVLFEVNGNRREIKIVDKSSREKNSFSSKITTYVSDDNPNEIGASIPGKLIKLSVSEGDKVKEGQEVAVVEAMKMETSVTSKVSGLVEKIYVSVDDSLESRELIMIIK